MRVTKKTGAVIGVLMVTDDDQIMLITTAGKLIRLRVSEVRRSGRNTQGVRLIGLESSEEVVAIARLAERDDPEQGPDGNGSNGGNGGDSTGSVDDGGGEGPDGDSV
jgi:DNA gyrase subunit A